MGEINPSKKISYRADRNQSVLAYSHMPAVVLEFAFMTNKQEAELLTTRAYRQDAAQAVVSGVLDYFGTETPGGDLSSDIPLESLIDKGIIPETERELWEGRYGSATPTEDILDLVDKIT
jgi:hypothetical protein